LKLQMSTSKVVLKSNYLSSICWCSMFVMGVNHWRAKASDFVSNAFLYYKLFSLGGFNDNFGIVEALMTTVHATTSNDYWWSF
jgi:glyceraldehyde-3-phosphate dehydrogenase/erythrose-4-phosphate dehydrogenase